MALLIYGMKIMSEGLQKAADRQMRKAINTFTQSRFTGLISGFFLTTILQSSTVVSVTLVGFAGVGIVPTINSLAVIMGANIGTTVTGWLTVLFNYQYAIHRIIMPLFILAVPLIITGKYKWKFWGQFLMGFGLLLLGLDMIGKATPNLEDLPVLFGFAETYGEVNLMNIGIYLLIGFLATLILQSSSALIVLTIILSGKGWMGYELAVAMIVGSNIGTTITALLASLVSNYKARIPALVHLGFNLFGAVWFLLFYRSFIALNDLIITKLFGLESVLISDGNIPLALALAHTTFNILNTILLIGFTNHIHTLVSHLVIKDKKKDIVRVNLLSSPIQLTEFNVIETGKSVYKYAEIIGRMNGFAQNLLFAVEQEKIQYFNDKLEKYKEINHRIKNELTESTEELSQQELSQNSNKKVRALDESIDKISAIAEKYIRVTLIINIKINSRIWFTENQRQHLGKVFSVLDSNFSSTIFFIDETNGFNKEDIRINKDKLNTFHTFINNLTWPHSTYERHSTEGEKKGHVKFGELLDQLKSISEDINAINDAFLTAYH